MYKHLPFLTGFLQRLNSLQAEGLKTVFCLLLAFSQILILLWAFTIGWWPSFRHLLYLACYTCCSVAKRPSGRSAKPKRYCITLFCCYCLRKCYGGTQGWIRKIFPTFFRRNTWLSLSFSNNPDFGEKLGVSGPCLHWLPAAVSLHLPASGPGVFAAVAYTMFQPIKNTCQSNHSAPKNGR